MEMNLKNMRKLRTRLRSRKNPVGFNMRGWFYHNGELSVSSTDVCCIVEEHSCGTVACLAGHAALLAWQSGDVPKEQNDCIEEVARRWLGMTDSSANDLFFGNWNNETRTVLLRDLTKRQAIAELTRLIEAE